MIKLYSIPLSTNVERVTLAMGHKGLRPEHVVVPPEDRSLVEKVSGQPLVPVIDHDGTVVADSTEIVRYLEAKFPQRPLFPADAARRAEMEVFIDWFNRAWKRPPNEIYAEMEKERPDRARIDRLGAAMAGYLDTFEGLLAGRDYLMGSFSAADCIAFPFVKYALLHDPDDDYLFHRILVDHQRLGDGHPRVEAWIRRCDRHPRA
jgi:glutathione S-transferase